MTVPPIHRAVIVDAAPDLAFAVFTDDFGGWWPIDDYSAHGAGGSVSLSDGEIVEISAAGEQAHWGSVNVWEPPHRLAFSWHPGRPDAERSSQVEVRFTDIGGRTLVVLEHSGWEVFDDPEAARSEYGNGWPGVLDEYAAAVIGDQIFVALQHRPGPAADPHLSVFSQAGFADHVSFLERLQKRGLVMAAGPFQESGGEGMTVLRLPAEAGVAEAERLATEDDQSVVSGFLTVEVRPWQVVVRG